jgi:hypothetical protein
MQIINRLSLFILILAAIAMLNIGCAITGKTSEVLNENIISCSLNTEIGFLVINDEAQACYRESGLYFVIENTGSEMIHGLSILLYSDYNITMVIHEEMAPGDIMYQNLNFGTQTLGGVKSLTLFPFIGENEVFCRDATIGVELPRC